MSNDDEKLLASADKLIKQLEAKVAELERRNNALEAYISELNIQLTIARGQGYRSRVRD